jgi:Zn-dependent protease
MTAEQSPAPPPAAAAGVSLIFLALIAAFGISIVLLAGGQLAGVGVFAFVFIGWIVSLCLHEWGHAFTAWKGGDASIVEKGYLTLDPLRYANPFLSIVLPLMFLAMGGIGFPGGAVYVQTSALRGPLWRAAVSAAGPAMNLLCLCLLAAVAAVLGADASTPLIAGVAFLAFLQATALILNLLPVPGFDGFGVIEAFLPAAANKALAPLKGVAFLLFFVLVFVMPSALSWLWAAALALCEGLGIDRFAVVNGFDQFRFWAPGNSGD